MQKIENRFFGLYGSANSVYDHKITQECFTVSFFDSHAILFAMFT